MKNKLKLLPVLNQSTNCQPNTRYNPEQVDEVPPTVSLNSNQEELEMDQNIQERAMLARSRVLTRSNASSTMLGRKDFVTCVKNILDRSGSLLSGED